MTFLYINGNLLHVVLFQQEKKSLQIMTKLWLPMPVSLISVVGILLPHVCEKQGFWQITKKYLTRT